MSESQGALACAHLLQAKAGRVEQSGTGSRGTCGKARTDALCCRHRVRDEKHFSWVRHADVACCASQREAQPIPARRFVLQPRPRRDKSANHSSAGSLSRRFFCVLPGAERRAAYGARRGLTARNTRATSAGTRESYRASRGRGTKGPLGRQRNPRRCHRFGRCWRDHRRPRSACRPRAASCSSARRVRSRSLASSAAQRCCRRVDAARFPTLPRSASRPRSRRSTEFPLGSAGRRHRSRRPAQRAPARGTPRAAPNTPAPATRRAARAARGRRTD